MPVKAIVPTVLQTRHTIPCLETWRAMHRMCIVFRRGRMPHRKIPAKSQSAVSNWTWNVFFGYFLDSRLWRSPFGPASPFAPQAAQCAKESNSRISAKKTPGLTHGPSRGALRLYRGRLFGTPKSNGAPWARRLIVRRCVAGAPRCALFCDQHQHRAALQPIHRVLAADQRLGARVRDRVRAFVPGRGVGDAVPLLAGAGPR